MVPWKRSGSQGDMKVTLLREKAVVSYLEIFFLSGLQSINCTFPWGQAAEWCQPQGICSVSPESYSLALGPVRSSMLHSKWGRPQEDRERPETRGWGDSLTWGLQSPQEDISQGPAHQGDSLTKVSAPLTLGGAAGPHSKAATAKIARSGAACRPLVALSQFQEVHSQDRAVHTHPLLSSQDERAL